MLLIYVENRRKLFTVSAVSKRGESNRCEGVQLFTAYAVLAVAFLVRPCARSRE